LPPRNLDIPPPPPPSSDTHPPTHLLTYPPPRWRLPKELALDLASLALYDIVMFVDDSGSMAFEENGERIDDLKVGW
jgi:hypothetical protein